MSMENFGLIWNGKDLRILKRLYKNGESTHRIASVLGRSIMGCQLKINAIRTAELINSGSDTDTLRTIGK